jgi:hypothetical protein
MRAPFGVGHGTLEPIRVSTCGRRLLVAGSPGGNFRPSPRSATDEDRGKDALAFTPVDEI